MAKPLHIKLTITAVILFISALIVDISQLGSDWTNLLGKVDLIKLVFSILICIAIGLVLGLFIFYKRQYLERISLTIPIAFGLFSLTIIGNSIFREYGLFEIYNYFTAKRDIKNGKIQLLSTGLILPPLTEVNEKAEEAIREQFGYKEISVGCIALPGIDK